MLLLRWPSFKDSGRLGGRLAGADTNYAPGQREQEDMQGWPMVCWYYVKATQVCLGRRGHDNGKHEPFVVKVAFCEAINYVGERCELVGQHKDDHKAVATWKDTKDDEGRAGLMPTPQAESILRARRQATALEDIHGLSSPGHWKRTEGRLEAIAEIVDAAGLTKP